MTGKQKKRLLRIVLSAALWTALLVLLETGGLSFLNGKWYGFLPWLVPYVLCGYDTVTGAFKKIFRGQVFDEEFLMMIATAGAFVIGEYPEGAAVMILFKVGELFESYAVGKSRESVRDMMKIAPESAHVVREGGICDEAPEDVSVSEEIVIKPGERVPLDGVVTEGASLMDTSSLTGEPVPRAVRPGDCVISGTLNGNGTLRVRVTSVYEDSTVARILELVENASSRKAPSERFISRFARIYTPAVTILAVLLAVIPPLVFRAPWTEWLRRACTFLVISCPCALVISVPLSFFSGIGAASKKGILVKGSNYLEAMARVKTVIFDKTGTLTKGEFRVKSCDREALLYAAALEQYSDHPIAGAILSEARAVLKEASGSLPKADEVTEIPGFGLSGIVNGEKLFAGSSRLMEQEGLKYEPCKDAGTAVYVSGAGYMGCILIADTLKAEAKDAVREMKDAGIRETVMLSGDREEEVLAVSKELGIDRYFSELLPADKVDKTEEILNNETAGEKTAFIGDGMNDAAALMRSDVGIAMGALGSDAAIEAADIVLMDDDVRKVPEAVRISRKTLRIVRENIIFSLAVKLAVLILGAFGIADMWLAVFADVGVCVIAVLNAMRAMRTGK